MKLAEKIIENLSRVDVDKIRKKVKKTIENSASKNFKSANVLKNSVGYPSNPEEYVGKTKVMVNFGGIFITYPKNFLSTKAQYDTKVVKEVNKSMDSLAKSVHKDVEKMLSKKYDISDSDYGDHESYFMSDEFLKEGE